MLIKQHLNYESKTYKSPTVGVKELSTRECLDILYEVEDYFWGDRSGFDKIMHAQMVFAKELRKRIAALQPNIKTQKQIVYESGM